MKELLLFVPGLGANEPGQYLRRLLDGIEQYCADRAYTLESVSDADPDNEHQRVLSVTTTEGETREIEIREISWSDLRPRLSDQPPLRKLVLGLDLLRFWIFSARTWHVAARSKYLLSSMLVSLVVFVAWYWGAIASAFIAVGATPLQDLPIDLSALRALGETIGGWHVWAIASAILATIPATAIIDISFATKRYTQNRAHFQQKVTARIKRELIGAARKAEPPQVTLLAHSFGVVAAMQALAETPDQHTRHVRLVTLGGPVRIVQARWPELADTRESLEEELRNGTLGSWTDYYCRADWMCSDTPVDPDTPGFSSQQLSATVAWTERLNGASHNLYFDDYIVLEELLES